MPNRFERLVYWLFSKIGLVVATKKRVDADASDVYWQARTRALKSGEEIGILHVLRYTKGQLSEPKWNDIAEYYRQVGFDFDSLEQRYPENPLCQKLKLKSGQKKSLSGKL